MNTEQKKITIINWIKTLEDEFILDQLRALQNPKLDELPGSIRQLLDEAEAEPESTLVKHTSAKNLIL